MSAMIEKFIHIKSLGKFTDWSATGDVQFKKLTLIYGENGYGKSTLTAILRSLSSNTPATILERGKLSSTEPISISLRARGATHDFKNKTWNAPCNELMVFDSYFVERNVFSGERIDTDHRRNLFQVVLGVESISLVEAKTAIDKDIAAKTTAIGEKGKAVDGHKPATMTRERFVALAKLEDVNDKIVAAKKRVAAVSASQEITALKLPAEVAFVLPDKGLINTGLMATIETVSQSAIEAVRKHIASCMDERGEKWIEQGIDYIEAGENNCPFCGQSLNELEIISAYNGYFSEAYSEHCKLTLQLASDSEQATSDTKLLSLRTTLGNNATAVVSWRKYLSGAKEPIIDIDAIESTVKTCRTSLNTVLQAKVSAPLSVVIETAEVSVAFQGLAEVTELISTYNLEVREFCNVAEALRKKAGQDTVQAAQSELDRLEGSVTRHKPEVVKLVDEYQQLSKDKQTLEERKKKAVEALNKKSDEVIAKYQKSINEALERFGTEFRIVRLKKDYVGQTPNAKYALQLDGREVGLDDAGSGSPSFRCTLSAGDKTTMAFAFFLAMLEQCDLSKSIIVIDDPISSLDYFREAHTCCAISEMLDKAEQVVVLSHHPEFLCKLWKSEAKAEVKTLEIYRGTNGSAIREWKIEEVARSEYERNWWTLKEYTTKNAQGSLEDIARCIRPLLEDYLRLKFVDGFEEGDWLGDQIKKIREAPQGSELAQGQPLLDELSALNDFTKSYHHGTTGRQAAVPKLIDTALKPMALRALALISAIETTTKAAATV